MYNKCIYCFERRKFKINNQVIVEKVNDMKQTSIAAVTLGCKVNYAETSSIIDMLVSNGCKLMEMGDGVDMVIIHTCAVTGEAERKSRQQIRKIIRDNPGARVVVTGCYAQLDPQRLAAIEGVSLVLGMAEKFDSSFYRSEAASADRSVKVNVSPTAELRSAQVASSMLCQRDKERTRAFLKIQDGCSFNCSYCTIPLARGRSRAVPLGAVIERAKRIAEAGYREIVLTGINIADYRDGNTGFADILRYLEEVEVSRIRISSIEPELLDDEIIELVASSAKIMPHFHLPLQSGSDKVLRSMGRHYDTGFYRERLMKVISSIPGCAVGVDVMIGYPGESESDFHEMFSFIEQLPVAYLHVFTCSIRPGTRLFRDIAEKRLTKVSSSDVASRAARMGTLGEKIERRFAGSFSGTLLKVLFEEGSQGSDGTMLWSGYSQNYLRVQVQVDARNGDVNAAMRGSVHEVFVEGFGEGLQLQGRLLS
ncbi:MAG: tRNA (N(6)-L-threonylcarbamoyladenosine(37)-C(2))-methylthiotransferase MtaB [Chlorobiaceae bacterium]|nr:tRNA (N(6)-L-threonylcarbamoyladenosine(37)-C(2))-methylthiotransferase MtaB [Chlorobiaceae bacterium]